MSLFVRIAEPEQVKKAMIISKMSSLNNVKRFEESKTDKKTTKEKAVAINEILLSIPKQIDEIKKSLPEIDVKSMGFEKGMIKCQMCGKRFKTESGLKVHQTSAHTSSKVDAETRNISEIERLNREIEELEKELKNI